MSPVSRPCPSSTRLVHRQCSTLSAAAKGASNGSIEPETNTGAIPQSWCALSRSTVGARYGGRSPPKRCSNQARPASSNARNGTPAKPR
ncbi:hypothetical protein D3C71_1747410 [compost metagenome]